MLRRLFYILKSQRPLLFFALKSPNKYFKIILKWHITNSYHLDLNSKHAGAISVLCDRRRVGWKENCNLNPFLLNSQLRISQTCMPMRTQYYSSALVPRTREEIGTCEGPRFQPAGKQKEPGREERLVWLERKQRFDEISLESSWGARPGRTL